LKNLERIRIGIAVCMLIFQLITIRFAFINTIELQTVHLAFALTLVFLTSMETAKTRKIWPLLLTLIAGGFVATGYVIARFTHLEIAVGLPDTPDVIIGVILMIVVLEATRQSWGMVFFLIIVGFIAYFFLGQYAPFGLKHPGFAFDYVVSKLGIGFSGIYSEFLNASVQYVFLFMVLGGVLKATGTVELILDLGKVIGRFTAGGRAQTAVVGSGLIGTITGAAVTNVILTGSFTIPAMKQIGYPPDIAGAIESTASTGGQLMPPVMGASAFIMATILGIPYRDIMVAALIPAFLYYFQVFASVEIIARHRGLKMTEEPIALKQVLRRAPPFVVAVGILFVLLLRGVSPSFAATYSLVAALGIAFLIKDTRPTWSNLAENITDGVMVGARLAVILASVGMIAQTLYSTGLGIKLTGLAEEIAGGQIIVFILLTMIISLILGCGVPTIGAYTLVALIVAPALVRAGFPLLPVHFFAFYFAIISAITPPVALAAVAAAGISGGNPWRTGLESFKISMGCFLLPFFMLFNPAIMMQGGDPLTTALSLLASALVFWSLAVMTRGYFLARLRIIDWLLIIPAAVLLSAYVFSPANYVPLAAGIIIFIVANLVHWRNSKASTRDGAVS